MKSPNTEQYFMESREFETCFGVPANPVNLTLQLFANASYLLEWKDPPTVFNSPAVCYYLVDVVGVKSNQFEVRDRFFYLSKEESVQKSSINVFSVYDIRCLTASFPSINNCKHKKLVSTTGASFEIRPATDYTLKGDSNLLKFSKITTFFSIILIYLIFY